MSTLESSILIVLGGSLEMSTINTAGTFGNTSTISNESSVARTPDKQWSAIRQANGIFTVTADNLRITKIYWAIRTNGTGTDGKARPHLYTFDPLLDSGNGEPTTILQSGDIQTISAAITGDLSDQAIYSQTVSWDLVNGETFQPVIGNPSNGISMIIGGSGTVSPITEELLIDITEEGAAVFTVGPDDNVEFILYFDVVVVSEPPLITPNFLEAPLFTHTSV